MNGVLTALPAAHWYDLLTLVLSAVVLLLGLALLVAGLLPGGVRSAPPTGPTRPS